MTNFMSMQRVKTIVAAAIIGCVVAGSGAQAEDRSQCGPRHISQNIKDAVLAMKAAQFCKGLPYTINEAAHRVEDMRCNAEASTIIDRLLIDFDDQYRAVLAANAGQVVCSQAAQLDLHAG